jgi:hypothetical protein
VFERKPVEQPDDSRGPQQGDDCESPPHRSAKLYWVM